MSSVQVFTKFLSFLKAQKCARGLHENDRWFCILTAFEKLSLSLIWRSKIAQSPTFIKDSNPERESYKLVEHIIMSWAFPTSVLWFAHCSPKKEIILFFWNAAPSQNEDRPLKNEWRSILSYFSFIHDQCGQIGWLIGLWATF